jgi:N-methylhydantoinase B/oxoprolinase/acetone carboxylase alpha subunit
MEVGTRTGKPYTLGPIFDRTRIAAEGYEGGMHGGKGAIVLSDGRALQDKSQILLGGDERFTLQLPGGGGFYDPFTRDAIAVLVVVLDGFVSLESAARDYGVVIDPATMRVDAAATAERRSQGGRGGH